MLSVEIGVYLWLVCFALLCFLGKLLNIFACVFHSPSAFEISLPLSGLCERFGRVLIESLSHHCDEIADDTRMIEQRLDD